MKSLLKSLLKLLNPYSDNELNKNHGSALVELCLVLFFLVPCFLMGLSLLGAAASRILVQKFLYESLICNVEDLPPKACEKTLRQQLNQTLPFGHLIHLQINSLAHSIKGEVHWQWNSLWTLKVSRTIPREIR